MSTVNSLNTLHDNAKMLSVKVLFNGSEGVVRSLQILKDGLLPEHVSKTNAMLLCVSGEVTFEDENKTCISLKAGEFCPIFPEVKHWVRAIQDSQLILIK